MRRAGVSGPGRTEIGLLLAGLLWAASPAAAGWELGLKASVDSNVTRSVSDPSADTYLWGALGYTREARGEDRADWTLAATLDGAVYAEQTGFNYVALCVAPGIVYVPFASWTLTVSPFVQGKSANDDSQSSLAWGLKLYLQQQLGASFYLAEHYTYTDSDAEEDVFSYREHALGATAGYNWTPRLVTEVGYQYAHGDSFRTLSGQETTTETTARQAAGGPDSGAGGAAGSGNRRGVRGFGGDVVKDTVSTHQVSATLSYDWTDALGSHLGYAYSVSEGDDGTSRAHLGSLGVAYRF